MTVLSIVTIILGLAFLIFGYLIRFRKMYRLINGFEAERRADSKDKRYAEWVGMTEFVLGIALITIGVILIIFCR